MTLNFFSLGIIFGFFLLILIFFKKKYEIIDNKFQQIKETRTEILEEIIGTLKINFSKLFFEAFSKSTDEFLKLTKSKLDQEREITVRELDFKKNLIDQQLSVININLSKVTFLLEELKKDRIEKFQELTFNLKKTGEQTLELSRITASLKEALASSKIRGQWGERMAEDVLRLCGFVETINYVKQKTSVIGGTRPDFTFFLPKGFKLNMDVKFPLDNYLKSIEAVTDLEKKFFQDTFLRNVKDKIKEVSSKNYIDITSNTVDCVLLFIPNEHIYAFIHEKDKSILENSLKNKVILCSPITLYAVLAIIRQAVDYFALEKTSHEILGLFASFKEQWEKFINQLDKVGRKLAETQKEYEILNTTRRKQLEKPFLKIEEFKSNQIQKNK